MASKMTKTSRMLIAMALASLIAGASASPSLASGPALKVYAPFPESAAAGEAPVKLRMTIQNVGDTPTTAPIKLSDTAGPDLSLLRAAPPFGWSSFPTTGGEPTCETVGATAECSYEGSLPPGGQIFIVVEVAVEPTAEGVVSNAVSVSGGGAPGTQSAEQDITVGAPLPFNLSGAAATLLNGDGSIDAQAASDPAEFAVTAHFRTMSSKFFGRLPLTTGVEHFKDVTVHLPPGLIGDPSPSVVPTLCTLDQLSSKLPGTQHVAGCPVDSQVGVAHIYMSFELAGGVSSMYTGLYNMVAPPGAATELGFQIYGTVILIEAHVRPGDHGIDMISRDTTTTLPITGFDIQAWGDPADPSHDPYRGACLESEFNGPNGQLCPTTLPQRAFLRLPTSCSGQPLGFGVESNSFEKPGTYVSDGFTGPTMTGCDLVPFAPSIGVFPTGTAANSPTGVSVKVSLPQNENPEGLAEADLKKAVVTLPEGMAINPSAADGLQACDEAQLHLDSNTPASCPDGSKIGSVLLHTQLIPNPIEGSIFLLTQNSSDPRSGEMFRMAIELRDDAHGLDFKIIGHIAADPITGRLTTTFDDNPQFPFEDISLHFKSGARAPLTTPASCQPQTTEAELYSWAQPNVPVHRANTFTLTSGPEGLPCMATQPFAPSFDAGVRSVQAGGFTPFLSTFSRRDADQSMQRVSVKLPLGLSGSLRDLPLCPEAQANAGTCSAASEIGSVTAGAGSGPTPFYVTGGKIFMTGPYKGAPFGLSIVVPAKAGPFDLGTVVVRATVELDVHTAQLTVTTDPLPQVIGGVPVNLRLVNVTIDRPNFVFNPTNCEPTSVTGTMTGGQGAVAHLESHFQVTNCGGLTFKPTFTVATSASASRERGASLDVKLSYPTDAFGRYTNIAKVKVELPKQLPSRLTTLQKACPDSVFNANPAACPTASLVGTAKASTPIMPVPLEGPAYFVSHGGAKFPELIIVLQGMGVTVELDGETFIDKAGITSSTFNALPDVPIGNFELTLPEGPYSALAANGDLCAQKLAMPTTFTAQNGAVIEQKTPIAVEGCTPEIRVVRHSVSGKRATVVVRVPSAGTLVAGGGGVVAATRRIAKAGTVTLHLRLSKQEQRFVANHHGRRLRVPIKLAFKPGRGGNLHAVVAVLMR